MDDARRDTLVALFGAVHDATRSAAAALGDRTGSATRHILGLLAAEGDLRISTVAAAVRIPPPAIAHSAAQLEDQGLIARRPDPADARHALLSLTAAGHDAVAEWRARLAEVAAPALTGLAEADWAILAAAARIISSVDLSVERLRGGLSSDGAPATPGRGLHAV
ncbi:MarR family winged helix-turn-helix transcriptional regulator [Demequina soli]|uniref:MarR family winged helix-turn-helix transcriptional regulator n=1 Tax=Demequina soli TaxID=1638987 RepID=UPI00078544AB|nr:MarR family winged helix-turn-helix transcriptional regulator [Demequina soli]